MKLFDGANEITIKLSSLLSLLIEALFVSTAWVYLYTKLLLFLNSLYRPKVTEIFYRPELVHPEPFEISLYLFLSVCFMLIIWLYYTVIAKRIRFPKIKDTQLFIFIIIKIFLFICLAIIFVNQLGGYPLALQIDPYPLRSDTFIYTVGLAIYLISIGAIIIEIVFLQHITSHAKKYYLFWYGIVVFIIGLITFEPGFPIAGLDYPFFYGPIQEIVKGKTIFTDVISQYGFLSVLVLAFLNKIHLFAIAYLPALIWLFYIIEYFLCFYLIYKIGKSFGLALIGLFSIITVNYYSLITLPIVIPEIGAFRWILLFISLFILYHVKKIDNPFFIVSIVISSLWMIDVGIALLFSYVLTLFMYYVSKRITLKSAIKSIVILITSISACLIFISLLHILTGYKLINYFDVLSSLRKYGSSGLGMIAITSKTFFWTTMLIYFTSVILFFRQKKLPVHNDQIMYAANIMFFASIYFVGRSHLHNLFNISIFFILTTFLLIGVGIQTIRNSKVRIFVLSLLFVITVIYPAYMRHLTMVEMFANIFHQYQQKDIFRPAMDEYIQTMYRDELPFIKKNMKEESIAILSTDDTFLFYLTGKKNLLDVNPQFGIDSKSDMDFALKTIVKKCPEKIVVDCLAVNKCVRSQTFGGTFFNTSFILSELEKQCKLVYRPIKCTKLLCIAESKIE